MLLTQIEIGTIANQLGILLMDKATSFLNSSTTLKSVELAEIRQFCDSLLEPHFTTAGSLIFKLNRNLENYTKKRENHVEAIYALEQTNSAYGKLFQPLSNNGNKLSENQGKAEKQDKLASIEESLINQDKWGYKPA